MWWRRCVSPVVGSMRDARLGERVVRTVHAALGRRLLVLLDSHGILLKRARVAQAARPRDRGSGRRRATAEKPVHCSSGAVTAEHGAAQFGRGPRLSAASTANGLSPGRRRGRPRRARAAAARGRRSWRGTSGSASSSSSSIRPAGRARGSSASTSSSLSASSAAAASSPATKQKRAVDLAAARPSAAGSAGSRAPDVGLGAQMQPELRRRAPARSAARRAPASAPDRSARRRPAAAVDSRQPRRGMRSGQLAVELAAPRRRTPRRRGGADRTLRASSSAQCRARRRARGDGTIGAMPARRLVLASTSRYRRELLAAPAPAVRRRSRPRSTRRPRPAKRRPRLALRLALAKADAVAAPRPPTRS